MSAVANDMSEQVECAASLDFDLHYFLAVFHAKALMLMLCFAC